ncbi:MAG: flagellar basal body protein, partial [Pseudomonadota bacterium]
MTVGLLNVGVSGLRAAQVQLEVTGSNIANVDTPGFARRSAIQTSISSGGARTLTGGEDTGGGIGVRIDRIQRSYDQFLIGDLRSAAGGAAGLGAEAEWHVELERAIGTRDTGIAGGLTRFLDSAERLAAAPTSLPLRRDMLAAGVDVAAGFRETAARFARIDDGIVADLGGALTSANQALESLTDINRQLARTEDGSATATTLLDRRDSALDALAAELPISVEYLPQGRVGVRLANANGPKLIGEGQLSTLGLGEPGADGLPTLLVDANFAPRLVTIPDGGRAGARVGGLFAALAATRDAVDALDGLAADTATLANDAHRAGVDLAGDAGLALFTAADGTP